MNGDATLPIPNRLLTKEELAAYLAVSVAWVRKAVTDRTIPYTKIGKNLRFTPSQVEEILSEGERQALNDARPPARRRTTARNTL